DRRLRQRNSKQVRMDRPQTWRQGSKLYALHAALLDKRNRVLKVVVRVLGAVGREDSSGRHRLPVDRLDNGPLIRANLDQWKLANDFFERPLDQVKTRFEDVGLDSDLTLDSNDSAGRHLSAKIASFFDRNFARADVYENSP